MATIKQFEELEIWQQSRRLSLEIYKKSIVGTFRTDFGLRDQINRSSGSVPDNIAEGFERDGNREFIQFLSIAKGSTGELRSQLYRAMDREHITQLEFGNLNSTALTLGNRIGKFMAYLNQCEFRGKKFRSS